MGTLLPFPHVQRPVFEGLVLSLGGKNLLTVSPLMPLYPANRSTPDDTINSILRPLQQNAAATAITRSLNSSTDSHPKLVQELTHALLVFGTENINKQRIFTPVLVAGFELAQADVWNELVATSSCSQECVSQNIDLHGRPSMLLILVGLYNSLIKLVNLAARGLTVIKNIERLSASMKLQVQQPCYPHSPQTALN